MLLRRGAGRHCYPGWGVRCVHCANTLWTRHFPQRQTRELTKHHSLLTHGAQHLVPPVSFYVKGLAAQVTSSSVLDLKTPLIWCVYILNYTQEKDFGLQSRGAWEDSKNKLCVLLIVAAKCLLTSFICLSQWAVVGLCLLEKPLFLPENWK